MADRHAKTKRKVTMFWPEDVYEAWKAECAKRSAESRYPNLTAHTLLLVEAELKKVKECEES